MTLFAWPRAAAFGRVIPKNKIYENAAVSKAIKERFVQQVEQITWAYKLAPETVNLPANPAVKEIQVFRITLKGTELDREMLKTIDRAIPFPLIFELVQNGWVKVAAAYKRGAQNPKSKADSSLSVADNYFATGWLPGNTLRQALPVALDMNGLYEQLLHQLTPMSSRPQEPLADIVQRLEQLQAKQREIDKITSRLKREKQFNRKIEINAELRRAKAELKRLK